MGSIPVGSPGAASAPAGAAAAAVAAEQVGTALLPDDSNESAELAALAAYEASQAQLPAGHPVEPAAMPAALPGVAAAQPAQQALPQAVPVQQQHPLQAAAVVRRWVEPEVVDLTGDSPSPPSSPHRRRQMHRQEGGGGGCGRSARGGAAAALGALTAVAAAHGAEVVDLLGSQSPTKRRHGEPASVRVGFLLLLVGCATLDTVGTVEGAKC